MDEQRAWSSAPIILLDGHETEPAEVKVIRGWGYVNDIEEKERSMKVSFMAHGKNGEPREFLPSAWIPKNEEELVKIIHASHNKKRNIFYRIEIRRQDKIDRKIPIEELTPLAVARKSIYKGIAALKVRESDDWIFSRAALTNPLEDPSDERFPSAVGKAPRNFGGGAAGQMVTSGEAIALHPVEPPAYVTVTDSGDVNPGASAVMGPLGAYSLSTKLSKKSGIELTKKQRGALATSILKICGNMQMEIWGGKLSTPDMGINSFRHALSLVEEVVVTDEPLTDDLFEEDNFKSWQERVESESLKLWRWSLKMVDKTVDHKEDTE